MIIQSQDLEPRIIEDFEFVFKDGIAKLVAVDKDAGDTIDYDTDPSVVIFHIAAKPSQTDSKTSTPPEDITIFLPHVLYTTRFTRSVTPTSAEMKDELRRLIMPFSQTIQ